MGILFSKELLIAGSEVTLTVITEPVSATCTLTYDGNSYSSKTATVKVGTTISYSIYHSTYGTETGTIIMNSDKTLTCTGTYSTSTTETAWSQPALSAKGTLGGSNFAVYTNSTPPYNYDVWRAFDGSTISNAQAHCWQPATSGTVYVTMYNPEPIKITSITMRNSAWASAPTAGTLYGSNDNSSWTIIPSSWSNATSAANVVYNIGVTNTEAYKYNKIEFTTWTATTYGRWLAEITLTATKQTTAYTYYWNISV